MTTITKLTPTDFAILDGLRLFRFLTVDQMLTLRVAKYRPGIYEHLRDLMKRSKPLIGRHDYGALPGVGRLPHVYFLTAHGARVIADALTLERSEVPYPKNPVMTTFHLRHRTHCIDCEIAVRQWSDQNGQRVDFYSSYFNLAARNGARLRAQTKVDLKHGAIIPDGIFQMTDETGAARLFVLEMYNQHRTKRMTDKLFEYRYALAEKAINKAFEYPPNSPPRILCVFEDDKAISLTMERLRGDQTDFLPAFYPFFFFNTIDRVRSNFRETWVKLDREGTITLF